MEIKEIDINKIKPDANQPRKRFDPEAIESLSRNISTTGVINPIEVDESYTIVTGETRWRAAKAAGLKTIPTKIIPLTDPKLRFRRQFLENIHNNTMDIDETANAMAKYIKLFHEPLSSKDKGIEWLKAQTGKSLTFIKEHLDYLKLKYDDRQIVKNHSIKLVLNLGKMSKSAKNKYVKKLRSFRGRDVKLVIASAIVNNPDKADKILALDYSNMREHEVKTYLKQNIEGYTQSPILDIMKPRINTVEEISSEIMKLNNLLKIHSTDEIPNFQKPRIISLLYLLHQTIEQFNKERVKITD